MSLLARRTSRRERLYLAAQASGSVIEGMPSPVVHTDRLGRVLEGEAAENAEVAVQLTFRPCIKRDHGQGRLWGVISVRGKVGGAWCPHTAAAGPDGPTGQSHTLCMEPLDAAQTNAQQMWPAHPLSSQERDGKGHAAQYSNVLGTHNFSPVSPCNGLWIKLDQDAAAEGGDVITHAGGRFRRKTQARLSPAAPAGKKMERRSVDPWPGAAGPWAGRGK